MCVVLVCWIPFRLTTKLYPKFLFTLIFNPLKRSYVRTIICISSSSDDIAKGTRRRQIKASINGNEKPVPLCQQCLTTYFGLNKAYPINDKQNLQNTLKFVYLNSFVKLKWITH